MCNDPNSGGRMIDNIITNTLLPALSRKFLKRSLAKERLKGDDRKQRLCLWVGMSGGTIRGTLAVVPALRMPRG